MVETADVTKRIRHAIELARRASAAHRAEADLARSQFEEFASSTGAQVFRQTAQALRAEGYPFQVFTPAGSIRLASERSGDDYVELTLDTTRRPVAVILRSSSARGRRILEDERVVFEGPNIDQIDGERLLGFVLEALSPFLER
jgi:hypothetical protein